MTEERWMRLLDSDPTVEQLSREISPELLAFVREEAGALATIKRIKVLLSLVYLADDKLESLDESILQLCEACESDAEDWVRVISGIVLRWLKKIPRDRNDAFFTSAQDIAKVIMAAEKAKTTENEAFSLPIDVIPTHWPFLASQSLPPTFDIAGSGRNQHFTIRQRGEVLKKLKVLQAGSAVPSMMAVDPLPPKVKELLEDAPLLKPEQREVILKFFSSPSSSGLTKAEDFELKEVQSNAVDRPGKIESIKFCIKLDPVERKWNPMKKRKFIDGTIPQNPPNGVGASSSSE